MRGLKVWAGIFVCVFLFSGIAAAQVTTGTISGTVSDSSGAVVPGATLILRSVEKGISRTVSSDASGHYRAPDLELGSYEITVEAAGFQSVIRSGITLTVGREAVVDFTLQVGAVTQTVTVTGEAPLVQTANATVAAPGR
jgi:Carboxypeptidase regulatory-like domain